MRRLGKGLAIAFVVVWSIAPILLVAMSSFKPALLIFEQPPRWLFTPTLENYRSLFEQFPDFLRCLKNSLIITVGATAVTLASAALAGYVYARCRGGALAGSAFFMVAVRTLPPIVITLPLFPAVNFLGLNDTHLVLILLYATFFVSLSTWIVKAGVDQIPVELEEASRVDGASLAQTLRTVVLPLLVPTLVAAGVFVVVFAWNEFLFAFIFTTTKAKTAPLILSEMLGSATGVDWGAVFAAATLQLAPILALVMLAQKHVVEGMTAGAVKQ